jgi:hypothetical protein
MRGERDTWLSRRIEYPNVGDYELDGWRVAKLAARTPALERHLANIVAGEGEEVRRDLDWQGGILAVGPEDLVRPALCEWQPDWSRGHYRWSDFWLKHVVARYELEALPLALGFARYKPAMGAALLVPFLDGEVAIRMAGWLSRSKTVQNWPSEWLWRHGRSAIPYLLPFALGKRGRDREAAAHMLRLLARKEKAAIIDAARSHGEQAVSLVEELLDKDSTGAQPTKKVPTKLDVDVHALPRVLLTGRERALPASAVQNLLTMLAMSTLEEAEAELAGVLKACDARSLADFGWALFRYWRDSGTPAKSAWQFTALGWLGDDETVRELVPIIRAWPGDGGHRNAVRGIDVLASIGTDLALRAIHTIDEKTKYGGLGGHAYDTLKRIATARGLSYAQLTDRLIPDFGLDTQGTLVLDYGPRRFTVGFDETLKPYVLDEDGKRRAALPKPGARDDADLAAAAYQRFTHLKKDVGDVARSQLGRLESAMLGGRRWTLAEFRATFVEHPLLWHIARRLVWCATHDGQATAFRLAEDRTFADVGDAAVALPDDAAVRIPHPLQLGETLTDWTRIFADYEILQPFPQLGRDVYTLTDQEKASSRLTRFENVTVPFGKLLGLEHSWHLDSATGHGSVNDYFVRGAGGKRFVIVRFTPGLYVGNVRESGDQTIETVSLSDSPAPSWGAEPPAKDGRHTFAKVDPITASEIIADLKSMTGR